MAVLEHFGPQKCQFLEEWLHNMYVVPRDRPKIRIGRTSAELLTNIRCRSFRQRELPNIETFRNFFILKRPKISSKNTIMEIQYSKNTISIVFPQFYFHYIVFPQLYFHYIVFPHSENTSSFLQNFCRSF